MNEPELSATVVITTKNRKEELRNALKSTVEQSVPVEILVFDDGSTDGTSDLVREEFPQVRVERVDQSLGIVRARNAAIELASKPIVFTLDDDCVFVSPRTVEQTLAEFDHPRVGAVCIPSMDVKIGPKIFGMAPAADQLYVASEFRGGANAMRRDLFLKLGKYRGYLFRQGEEADYSIRLLDAGYVVRLGRGDIIHHYESPVRQRPQMYYYQARNHLLFVWYNVPISSLFLHGGATIWNVLRASHRNGFTTAGVKGVLAGFGAILHEWKRRRAVRVATYRLFRRLRTDGPIGLSLIEPTLNAAPATAT
jgi:GT2 family glycosyltransferase